jgi:hypothetical protein
VERRGVAGAIRLHDPTLHELQKQFCFRETKKNDFCIFFKTVKRQRNYMLQTV